MYEVGLLDRLRAKVGEKPAGGLQGVETIFRAMFLSREPLSSRADAAQTMSAHSQKAFDQLWALQKARGRRKADGDGTRRISIPGRTPSPAAWRIARRRCAHANASRVSQTAKVREQAAALNAYLMDSIDSRRLHDRLALLLAGSFIPDSLRQSITADALSAQQADGGWTIESLGPLDGARRCATGNRQPTPTRRRSPPFALLRGGVARINQDLQATAWLQSHQDPQPGAWSAMSMNKRYPDGSMESRFMQDAATAFASLALIEAGR